MQRLLMVSVLVAGCAPTYAPPVHSAHGGAPGRSGGERVAVELHGAAPGGVTPRLALPLGGRVSLEIGGDFASTWALGTAGLRLEGRGHELGAGVQLVPHLGLGAGIGRGGERCGNKPNTDDGCDGDVATPDGLSWDHRLAGGGYVGGGLGLHLTSGFAVFGRAAARVTDATGLPSTFWLSGLLGIDVRLGPVSAHLGGGWFGYVNEWDSEHGPFLEAGVTIAFEDVSQAPEQDDLARIDPDRVL